MLTISISFLLLLLASPTLPTSLAIGLCDENDAAALLDIKRSFGNPPYLASWNESSDCCDGMPLVFCDRSTGRVTNIFLQSPDIAGPIPAAITRLSALINVFISGKLTGTIPPFIANLTNLQNLEIKDNPRLTGIIPRELCSLGSLQSLDLSGNKLIGGIPDCFGPNLNTIDLGRNRLTGPIPNGFMSGIINVNPAPWLTLADNRLTGQIPPSLGDVPLTGINLSGNQFTGDVNFLFKEEGSLEEIYLSKNKLEFVLSGANFPLGLQVLKMEHNKVFGRIPQQISKLRALNTLDLSYNMLCGPIPTRGLMKNFGAASFEHNKCLCGGPLQPCR